MDKFFSYEYTFAYLHENKVIYISDGYVGFKADKRQLEWPEITREEFTAAALQAIEKLKAQGIDIGTDWLPKWEPKVGEAVCVWDDFDTNIFAVGVYSGQCTDEIGYKYSVNRMTWRYIAPFTGEIPEPFKSRWAAEAESNKTDKI
jgi:hypothetical protein